MNHMLEVKFMDTLGKDVCAQAKSFKKYLQLLC